MYEIKILCDTHIAVQKTMNTWKHKFSVKLHSITACPHREGIVYATICRTPKPE